MMEDTKLDSLIQVIDDYSELMTLSTLLLVKFERVELYEECAKLNKKIEEFSNTYLYTLKLTYQFTDQQLNNMKTVKKFLYDEFCEMDWETLNIMIDILKEKVGVDL